MKPLDRSLLEDTETFLTSNETSLLELSVGRIDATVPFGQSQTEVLLPCVQFVNAPDLLMGA